MHARAHACDTDQGTIPRDGEHLTHLHQPATPSTPTCPVFGDLLVRQPLQRPQPHAEERPTPQRNPTAGPRLRIDPSLGYTAAACANVPGREPEAAELHLGTNSDQRRNELLGCHVLDDQIAFTNRRANGAAWRAGQARGRSRPSWGAVRPPRCCRARPHVWRRSLRESRRRHRNAAWWS